jgi:two-component system sensor histidine kinase DesK
MSLPGNLDPTPGRYWSPHPYRANPVGRFLLGTERGDLWRRVFPSIYLLYLIPLAAGAGHRHSAPLAVAEVAIVVTFAGIFFMVIGWWWDHRPRLALLAIAVLAAQAALACFLFGKEIAPIWIYVAVACGIGIGSQWLAVRGIGGAAACFSAFSLAGHATTGDFLAGLLPLLFGGLAAVGFRSRFEITQELTRAKETVALLAASEERLRLARDMHDLTGQSLSTITLKSDLAARVLGKLPPSPERDRARDELQQIADVSRQALRDVREALSGYRRPTLAVESITARAALEAAGITVHDDTTLTLALSPGGAPRPAARARPGLPDGSCGELTDDAAGQGELDPDGEAALAWCLREAVTNVVRHSGARNCWLTLSRVGGAFIFEARDDGRGLADPASRNVRAGAGVLEAIDGRGDHAGLRGMSERLSAVGGRLEIRPGNGFCLIATVPAQLGANVARVAQ